MSHNPVNRLLRRNVSVPQIAGYAVATLVGLLIVLTAIQFYRDMTAVEEAEDTFISSDYVIISKKVNGVGNLGGEATTFTPTEREELASQPWAAKVGEFTAAQFNVTANVNLGGQQLSTALFLESIPDDFFDVTSSKWSYDAGSGAPVPVIISKDYLTLYNFGFAASRGMPQISEELISTLPLLLTLSGNGLSRNVNARIVGFSSRLNTIAVPSQFLSEANREFGNGETADPSRLIIKLRKAGDPQADSYLEAHGYERAGDRAAAGKAAYFTAIITGVVAAVGVIISVLAFFILLLSIYLLLQKNSEKIFDLMLLGYTPAQVARYYQLLVVKVNAGVLVISSAALWVGASAWQSSLSGLGLTPTAIWPTILIGTLLIAIITAANSIAIRNKVRGAFRK